MARPLTRSMRKQPSSFEKWTFNNSTNEKHRKQLPSKRTANDAAEEDTHDDDCRTCNEGGTLLLCAKCPAVYHLDCLNKMRSRAKNGKTMFGEESTDVDHIHYKNQSTWKSIEHVPDDFSCKCVQQKCLTRRAKKRTNNEPKIAVAGPVKRTAFGRRYYQKLLLDGSIVMPGSAIVVNTSESVAMASLPPKDTVAEVETIFKDQYNSFWLEVRWYYTLADTGMHFDGAHHRELFQTAVVDEIPVESLQDMALVLDYDSYLAFESLEAESQHECYPFVHPDRVFMCRQMFNELSGEFRPLMSIYHRRSADASKSTTVSVYRGIGKRHTRSSVVSSASNGSKFSMAYQQLQLSTLPKSLPCRTKEHDAVYNFLYGAVKGGGSSSGLYIAGMPGTGKTATVMQVVDELHALAQADKLAQFDFVEINGMKLSDPNDVYSILWKALKGKHLNSSKATLSLDRYFRTASSSRHCLILLVDEIDYILNKKQNVIYNLFDWPGRKHARLAVVCIANTMDLPELLMPRVHSRLGLTRINFPPYSKEQIFEIVKARLSGLDVMTTQALDLCARKISSVSGDIRRALQISRRAIEISEQRLLAARSQSADTDSNSSGDASATVGIDDVLQAVQELLNSSHVQFLRSCADHEQIFLASLLTSTKLLGIDDIPFAGLADRHHRICHGKGIAPVPSTEELLLTAFQFDELGICRCSFQRRERYPFVRLMILPDDIEAAFQASDLWQHIHSGV